MNRSKRFGFLSHSKWLLAEHAELVDPLVFLLLVLEVLADDFLVASYSRHEVPPCPETFSCEVSGLPINVRAMLMALFPLKYAGKVGTGFSMKSAGSLAEPAQKYLHQGTCPYPGRGRRPDDARVAVNPLGQAGVAVRG